MDAPAVTSTSGNPIVAEAGSREAPALPPGLLTDAGEACNAIPTKLFIGGISRHTTTKQLRDHFSAFGRVLDCVAMRQPDGRPRGFGYVTLDSPTAAERCLREPQMIDNRIVDMKAAVPEGTGSYATSPKEGCFHMGMFAGQGDFGMDMFAGHGFNGWPEGSGSFGNASWWNGARTQPHGQGLDCLELLSAARDIAVSNASSPHGLPLHSIGLSDYAECATGWDDEEPQSMLIPAEFQQPPGVSPKMSTSAKEFVPMSASAKEFVPVSVQAQQPSAKVAQPQKNVAPAPARKAARAPLGELNTNVIVEVEDLLKPFKSPTNKLADIGRGQLSCQADSPAAGNGRLIGRAARPTGLLLDDEDLDSASPSSGAGSSGDGIREDTPEPAAAKGDCIREDTPELVAAQAEEEAPEEVDEVEPLNFSDGSAPSEGGEADMTPVDLDNLPSIGSALHGTGECKRCNFFPKGRCGNGKNCQFCHYPHDKRKPSRQEKRERRAAWLGGQDDDPSTDGQSPVAKVGPLLSTMGPEVAQQHAAPFLFTHGPYPGGFHPYPEEEHYSDETLAYSIFPGLPPIHATKLPAPLPLPGMDMASQAGPALPPGLRGPVASTQSWQSEVQASPASFLGFDQPLGHSQVMFAAPQSLAPFATAPSPLSTTPASSQPPTPTSAMAHASAEGKTGPALPPGLVEPEAGSSGPRTLAPLVSALAHLSTTPILTSMPTPSVTPIGSARSMSTSTTETQTGDYKCRQCNNHGGKTLQEGCKWDRDELLRLRDRLLKQPQFSTESSSYTLRTQAIGSSTSN